MVRTWTDLAGVERYLVSFRVTFVFERDGIVLTSASTLRFRSRDELAGSLASVGLTAEEVRDARDRPGREFVHRPANGVTEAADADGGRP
jgi:hypothetical protein